MTPVQIPSRLPSLGSDLTSFRPATTDCFHLKHPNIPDFTGRIYISYLENESQAIYEIIIQYWEGFDLACLLPSSHVMIYARGRKISRSY